MGYPIINYTENRLVIIINVKAVIIVIVENENVANTVMESTKNDNNYITSTEAKLIF